MISMHIKKIKLVHPFLIITGAKYESNNLWCWPSWVANSPSFVGRTQRCNGSRQ